MAPDTSRRSGWRVRLRQARERRRFRSQDTARRFQPKGSWGNAMNVWLREQDDTGQTAGFYGFGNYPKVGEVVFDRDGSAWWVTKAERTRDPDDMITGRLLLEPEPDRLPPEPDPATRSWVETDLV